MLHFREGHRRYGIAQAGDGYAIWPVTHWESIYRTSLIWITNIESPLDEWAKRVP